MDSRPHFLEFSTYPRPELAPAPASTSHKTGRPKNMELIQWEERSAQLVPMRKSELMESVSNNHQSLQLQTSSKVLPEMKRFDKNLERSCQVEGCNLVLAGAKEYHKKHSVCERHSKAFKVVVKGIEQRFCQQCSR